MNKWIPHGWHDWYLVSIWLVTLIGTIINTLILEHESLVLNFIVMAFSVVMIPVSIRLQHFIDYYSKD